MTEPSGVTCAEAREAVSARLDGEDPGAPGEAVDAHLADCGDCRTWAARARIPLADVTAPDLATGILAAIAADGGAGAGGALSAAGGANGNAAAAPVGPARPARRQRLRTAAIAAAVVVVAGSVGAVAARLVRGGSSAPLVSTQQVAGSTQTDSRYPGATVLPVGVPKPHLVLTDTAGQPYDLSSHTAGKVTLVYFGYTHCPDVCPINMALAAQALAKMPGSQATQVAVVFISTDPARDTPPVIRAWLNNFSPTFVGLTGSIDAVEAAERQVGMATSVITPGGPAADGGYQVQHSGFTLVYSQDGSSHLQFFDTARPAQYATTLEHLVANGFQT